MSCGQSRSGGKIQRQDVEAIVEIFAEKPFLHQLDQVFLRRADHPHIDVHFMILANAAEGAVVEKAQQLGLHARRHLANFIQQHRAAVGLLEEALLALQRVAKQLALDRVLGNGATVERQIGFARPRTGQMAGMGQQIFTGAGVADNQQRRAEHRQLARLLHHVAHFRPHREDLTESAGIWLVMVCSWRPMRTVERNIATAPVSTRSLCSPSR